MTGNPGIHVLTDARWAELEPLIDEVRPHGKVPHDDLRQTIAAIVWRHQNGAKGRSIPTELGPWWKAAQTFLRWAHRAASGSACATWSSSAAWRSAWPSSTAPISVPLRKRRARKKGGQRRGARPP